MVDSVLEVQNIKTTGISPQKDIVTTNSGTGDVTVNGNIVVPDSGTIGSASATNAVTIDASGNTTFGGNLVIPDSGTIGSASDTDAITIDSSGNATFSGSLQTTGTTAQFISASNNINIQSNRASGATFSAITVRANSGSALNLIIWNNGNIVNANNSYGAISDEKLKENIIDATPKLEDLCKVRVVNYNLKTDPEHKHLGVIAQELENVFPNMIDNSTDYDADGNELGTTTKSVKYSVFTIMLIKATQEQQALIESQQSQIDALTARIEVLENAAG